MMILIIGLNLHLLQPYISSLLQSATTVITKCDSLFNIKCDGRLLQRKTAYFITKCDGLLLQSKTAFLLQSAMVCYYKVRQLFYYKVRQVLLQSAIGITKCNTEHRLV